MFSVLSRDFVIGKTIGIKNNTDVTKIIFEVQTIASSATL